LKKKQQKTGRTKQWPKAMIRLTYCKIKQVKRNNYFSIIKPGRETNGFSNVYQFL
jgi:hypothetical protein